MPWSLRTAWPRADVLGRVAAANTDPGRLRFTGWPGTAGVPGASVRYNGTIHDFVMLNALRAERFT